MSVAASSVDPFKFLTFLRVFLTRYSTTAPFSDAPKLYKKKIISLLVESELVMIWNKA